MSSRVVLPEWVARNDRRDRMLASADEHVVRRWNELLQEIDPQLGLAFVPENVTDAPGLVPGRWHVRRRNPMGPDTYWPVLGDDGSFREMDSGMLEQFRRGDHQNSRVVDAARRGLEAQERSDARAVETTREQRVHELASSLNALTRPSVAFNDRKWTAKAGGKRGRRK